MKRFIGWILLAVMALQVMASSLLVFAETPNDRIQNSINMARGKTLSQIDATQITPEDLQVIGVFLSNFYEPFNTEVVTARDEETVKAEQVKALTEVAAFDTDIAEVLVSACWEMSRSSAMPLYLGFKNGGDVTNRSVTVGNVVSYTTSGGVSGSAYTYYAFEPDYTYGFGDDRSLNEDGKVPATYFSFLEWFSGFNRRNITSTKFLTVKNAKPAIKVSGLDDLSNTDICLYWEKDNGGSKENVAVFDTGIGSVSDPGAISEEVAGQYTKIDSMRLTASSATYLSMLANLNYNKGVGSAISNASLEELENSDEDTKSKLLVTNSRLYVDCFGNILVDVAAAKYVLVPACMNPYAWASDKALESVGRDINLVNLYMLGLSDAGTGLRREATEDGKDPYIFDIYGGNHSLLNLEEWRLQRGSDVWDIDQNQKCFSWFSYGEGQFFVDALNPQIVDSNGQIGADRLYFSHWGKYISKDATLTKSYYKGMFTWETPIDDFIVLDTLQAFKNDDKASNYKTFKVADGGIFVKDGNTYKPYGRSNGTFNREAIQPGHLNIPTGPEARKYLTGIYCSYVLAYFHDKADEKTKYPVDYWYSARQFPEVSTAEIDWSNIKVSDDTIVNEIRSMIYYFMHPDKGVSFVAKWFKTKVTGILVKWHEDMVGGSDAANTTGLTKYIGFSGYVAMPNLKDIPWTAWLLNEYNNIVIYLIIIIFVILVAYCIVGSMTFQRAVLGVVMFAVLAFFPPMCINAAVNFLNNTCDALYGSKFTYWAIVQHATYLSDLKAAVSGTQDNYLDFLFRQQESVQSSNYARVKLKWLSPKKMSVTAAVSKELDSVSSHSTTLTNLLRGRMQQELSGETFSEDTTALYMYRDYADIYLYSSKAYALDSSKYFGITERQLSVGGDVSKGPLSYNGAELSSKGKVGLYGVYASNKADSLGKEFAAPFWMSHGFTVNTANSDYVDAVPAANKSYSYLLNSCAYARISANNEKFFSADEGSIAISVGDKTVSPAYGVGDEKFKLTLGELEKNNNLLASLRSGGSGTYTGDNPSELIDFFLYGMYTESPFYFFHWNILDQESSTEFNTLLSPSGGATGEKLMNMYTANNQQYFYNYNGNAADGFGEMRDYNNMHALFYYVIPYLRACNEGVIAWSNKYGTELYEDVKVIMDDASGEPVNVPDPDKETEEYVYKWWHNYNVMRLFNTYSAWVDVLYACDYAKPETIKVLGENYTVTDPLSPMSYCVVNPSTGAIVSGRSMVFSRSEMKYYGLDESDLTQVERKIVAVNDKVYEDLLQLMDYYNLGPGVDTNEVLTTAAGMLTTFAFNKEFSQTTPLGVSYTMYPQSYELKAFSYDAYLRLILAESTGESILQTSNANSDNNEGQKSYYQRIVEGSSITTGIGIIILDIVVVYAVPALRLFFLVVLFFLSVLMIVASAVKLELNMTKVCLSALVFPLGSFLGVSLGLAFLVSLFMSDGNTAVTGRGGLTIALGDPAMVVLVMIVINIAALVLYYKICRKSLRDAVNFAKAVGISIGGTVAGAFGMVASGIATGDNAGGSRGTAKARGSLNQTHVKSSAGGAIAGKMASVASKDKQSNIDKYNAKAANLGDKIAKASGEGFTQAEMRTKEMSQSMQKSADSVARQREALKQKIENSGALGKLTGNVRDKFLAFKQKRYQKAADKGENKFNKMVDKRKEKASKKDNMSRVEKYKAKQVDYLERAEQEKQKIWRKNHKRKKGLFR